MKPTAITSSVFIVTLAMLPAPPAHAQVADVPRTRTLPGIEAPAFPYAQPEEVGLSSEKLDRLGAEVLGWVAAGALVGAELLIVKDGRAVFHEAYGWSDREERRPVERNSIWSIKSMSKPFTAMAVLMLADEGALSLDDPVSRYIPGFAGDPRTTIRHLLSHTSGYREEVGDPSPSHTSFRHWVEDWAAQTPTGTLGEFWYTDFGFAAAGYIVEEVSGLPIGRFTGERIVTPLGLDDTSTQFSDQREWRARLNPFYWFQEGRYELRHPASRPAWRFYPAAWGMFSTAMDYAQFVGLWLNGGERAGTRLLSPATAAEAVRLHAPDFEGGYAYGWMRRLFVRTALPAAAAPFGGYGYGWFVLEGAGGVPTPAVIHHSGGDGTLAIGIPAQNAIIVWLTHSRAGPQLLMLWNRLSLFDVFETASVRDESLLPADASIAVRGGEDALNPDRYVGTYVEESPPGEAPGTVLRVFRDGGRLHLRAGAGASGDFGALVWHLVPLGSDRFALGRYRGDQLVLIDPLASLRFRPEHGGAERVELALGERVQFSARRIQ
jgi:CubicO group peptidase (beta-lactamase class C family)